jgi:hypothetical protein
MLARTRLNIFIPELLYYILYINSFDIALFILHDIIFNSSKFFGFFLHKIGIRLDNDSP